MQGTDHRPENTTNLPGQYPLVKFCLFFSPSFRDDLHQPVATYTRQVKQEFYKYPKPDYNFNYVDQLISGDQTILWEHTKYRRLLFNIVPPKVRLFWLRVYISKQGVCKHVSDLVETAGVSHVREAGSVPRSCRLPPKRNQPILDEPRQ